MKHNLRRHFAEEDTYFSDDPDQLDIEELIAEEAVSSEDGDSPDDETESETED
jgi:hypothetical protein